MPGRRKLWAVAAFAAVLAIGFSALAAARGGIAQASTLATYAAVWAGLVALPALLLAIAVASVFASLKSRLIAIALVALAAVAYSRAKSVGAADVGAYWSATAELLWSPLAGAALLQALWPGRAQPTRLEG